MEIIRNLIITYWRTGLLLLGGLILIIYIALGFLYWQQGGQQADLEKQTAQLSLVLARPLPSDTELRAEYEKVNSALAPMTDKNAIAMLVGIAEKSGIDVTPESGKIVVPSVSFGQATVGGGTYQVLSFGSVKVQGVHDSVMAFITDLDSGETLETMVLNSVATSQVAIMYEGEEAERRAEFRMVISAVINMMDDNALSEIPDPMSFAGGIATNFMGDDPDTEGAVEGFPDITTTAAEKGYTGTDSPMGGYVLYEHDRISTDNTTLYETVSYTGDLLTTNYYYTCEADGTVRQFDGASVITATEYLGSEESRPETAVTFSVVIYTRLGE